MHLLTHCILLFITAIVSTEQVRQGEPWIDGALNYRRHLVRHYDESAEQLELWIKEKVNEYTSDPILQSLQQVFANFDVSAMDSLCYSDVISTITTLGKMNATNGADYLWIIQLLDSQGIGLQRGILTGNKFNLGSYQECIGIKAVLDPQSSYNGMYCTAGVFEILGISLPPTIPFYRGFCLPNSCTDSEATIILQLAFAAYNTLLHPDKILNKKLIEDLRNITIEMMNNQTINISIIIDDVTNIIDYDKTEFIKSFYTIVPTGAVICHRPLDMSSDSAAIAMICVLSLLGLLMLIGTLYDYFSYQSAIVELPSKRDTTMDTMSSDTDHITILMPTKKEYYDQLPLVLKCFLAFSVYTNFPKIFDTTRREGTLDCIHGIRFISMSWVILGHVYVFIPGFIDNYLIVVNDYMSQFLFQAIDNATPSVDTFFLLSGLLLTFLWFKETDKRTGRNIRSVSHWAMYYLHRFIRLTPVYMLILGVSSSVTKYLSDGPMWPQQTGFDPFCKNYWWRNLLYIQNLFDSAEACMGVTWYLANDMQFYVVAPFFLIILYMYPYVGLAIAVAVTSSSAIARGVYNSIPGVDATKLNTLYMKPWMRIGPYLVGIIFGYILFKTLKKGKSFRMKKSLNLIGWLLATGTALAVIYGMYDKLGKGETIPVWSDSLYAGLNRTAWAIAVGWVCFACCTGNGGIVNSILSWSVWVPLSRLTYCAYLCHLPIIFMYNSNISTPQRFDGHITVIYLFFGNMIAAYSVALVFSLMFEAPILTLEKLLLPFGRDAPSKSKSEVAPKDVQVESVR